MGERGIGPALLGLFLGVLTFRGWGQAALCAAALAVLIAHGRQRWPALRARMRPFYYFAAVTLLFGGLGDGEPLVAVGPLVWSRSGLQRAGLAAVRLLLLGAVANWATITLGTERMLAGMWRAGRRLKRWRIDPTPVLIGLAVALRFLPLLQQEGERLRLAWQARTAGLWGRGPLAAVRGAAAFLVPLMAAALRRADDFVVAVELRAGRRDLPSLEALERAYAPGVAPSRRRERKGGGFGALPPWERGVWTRIALAWAPLALRVIEWIGEWG